MLINYGLILCILYSFKKVILYFSETIPFGILLFHN